MTVVWWNNVRMNRINVVLK